LHDIGYHISRSQHHRHSYYIIRNSSILGFNDTEIEIIANVARYHRKSHPKNSHEGFNSLSEDNKIIVKYLSAILRIADAFDRTHKNMISNIKVNVKENDIVLNIHANESVEVELWSLERRKELFEELFCRQISVVVE